MTGRRIIPYAPDHREAVLALSIAAWTPVFEKTRREVPGFVYDAFYPQGWQKRQLADVGSLLEAGAARFWLMVSDGKLLGFVGLQLHPEDRMGAIDIIAVAPEFQRRGIAKELMDFAEQHIREAGMAMVMVETVDDTGHAPARAAYEASGYERWPVARYFKRLV
jgi:ribosomal protein S18 acetylase RimI-like enzyme